MVAKLVAELYEGRAVLAKKVASRLGLRSDDGNASLIERADPVASEWLPAGANGEAKGKARRRE